MPYQDQPSFIRLRDTISERSSSIVIWGGAGLSMPAGFPSWLTLRNDLCEEARKSIGPLDENKEKFIKIEKAEKAKNLWIAFDILFETSKNACMSKITDIFNKSNNANCIVPEIYKEIWKIPISGFITLNIDNLALRAYHEINDIPLTRVFTGIDINNHTDVLQTQNKFLLNLHGKIDIKNSWVFTNESLRRLFKIKGYNQFIRNCLTSTTIIFIGISADDQAIQKHFEFFEKEEISYGNHYWITSRNDIKTFEWTNKFNIHPIYYSPSNNHAELQKLIIDLYSYESKDKKAPPITLPGDYIEESDFLDSDEIYKFDQETARKILNQYASSILREATEDSYKKYEEFRERYKFNIHIANFININDEKRNIIFGYKLEKNLGSGSFGQVYKARKLETGEEFAIKILSQNENEKEQLLRLQNFRRGAQSMSILSKNEINGSTKCFEVTEIPCTIVMEYIDGSNLQQLKERNTINEWEDILDISYKISEVIKNALALPERVLHRDIRPSNIMIKNFDFKSGPREILLLDFDLSWHSKAIEKTVIKGKDGFLAPEQISDNLDASTRSSLVDSFGLCMTIYYMITGEAPEMGETYNAKKWENKLREKILSKKFKKWNSLPMRFCRLIENSTKYIQKERIDINEIYGELKMLRTTISDYKEKNEKISPNLLIEELIFRAQELKNIYFNYTWDEHKICASINFVDNLRININYSLPSKKQNRNQNSNEISLNYQWSGEYIKRKKARKFLNSKIDKILSKIDNSDFYLINRNVQGKSFSLDIGINRNQLYTKMEECSEIFSASIDSAKVKEIA